jgi:catechol 2,3-dioxygenase-like lactoylglutathione lyase family enzyme
MSADSQRAEADCYKQEKRMKRMHVHVSVRDLEASVRFYSTLFAAIPTVLKEDYAKWMLDDPRVNFAISARDAPAGIEHLGIQVADADELHEVYERLEKADAPVLEEGETVCCYAKSQKSWIEDPQGIRWETFLTSGESTIYGSEAPKSAAACCVPSGVSNAADIAAACCTAEDRSVAKATEAACCA